MDAIGFDAYNQCLTGRVAKTLNNRATDSDHLPCVVEVIGADIYNLALTGDKACSLTSEEWTSTGTCPKVLILDHHPNDSRTDIAEDQQQLPSAKTKYSSSQLIILNDQGGAFMRVEKEDISPALRAQMAGHPPVVCYPTEPITLDVYHLSASRGGQTLKARDYKDPQIVCYAEKRFFEWHEDDKSVNIRASSGSYGGGSEVLVCTRERSEHYAEQTTSGFSNNK